MKKVIIKVIIGIIATAFIVCVGFVIRYDIIGYDIGDYGAVTKLDVEGNHIEAQIGVWDSINCIKKAIFEENEGIVTIRAIAV